MQKGEETTKKGSFRGTPARGGGGLRLEKKEEHYNLRSNGVGQTSRAGGRGGCFYKEIGGKCAIQKVTHARAGW